VDFLLHSFEASGVETWIFVPPLVAFSISFFTSMGGVSGAFLLLPFQVSVLGYHAPSVSATNHLYNVLAIPGGVLAYVREKRMLWPLALCVVMGTVPGVFAGAWIRILYLPDPRKFKFFAGLVLLYVGGRLLQSVARRARAQPASGQEAKTVTSVRFSPIRASFVFEGRTYCFNPAAVLAISLVVGVVGGIYGIGGGAIMAPIFVTVFGLPVHAVAGAALMGTFTTSTVAIIFYHILAGLRPDLSVAPDWSLGALFALGGIAGIFLGARFQKRFPARTIRALLSACVLTVAVKYIVGFIR